MGWGTEGELGEPSPLPRHCELTVNIRGNDIDFKVLWLQMSLMLSLSLLSKKPLPDVIYIFFPSSVSLVLYWGKTVRTMHPQGPKARALMKDSCESQFVASQVTHVGQP